MRLGFFQKKTEITVASFSHAEMYELGFLGIYFE